MKITINCEPRTKKNSQRLVTVKGRALLLPSKAYQQFEKECGKYLQFDREIDTPVNIKCIFYMPTRRHVDLSNLISAVDDVLTRYDVILDDNRDIVAGHDGSRVYYDKDNPRIEIEITPIENYEQWRKKDADIEGDH